MSPYLGVNVMLLSVNKSLIDQMYPNMGSFCDLGKV